MHILITKTWPRTYTDLVNEWGWSFDVVPALHTTHLDVVNLPGEADAWIISSRNSWPVVVNFTSRAPQFIYCIGSWTENQLRRAGVSSTIRKFDDMKSMADELSLKKYRQLLYFCGEHHRQDLENQVTGIVSVTTHVSELTCPVIRKAYDAVFVFSPRSAESLMKHNTFPASTIFACIGRTTERYVREHGIGRTFCASSPESGILLKEFKEFYSRHRSGV